MAFLLALFILLIFTKLHGHTGPRLSEIDKVPTVVYAAFTAWWGWEDQIGRMG